MTKYVRKFRPADYWYTEQYESWFSDMSLQGLHIKRFGASLVKFEKGAPRKMAYRVALTPDKEISGAQTKLYEENGWAYVTSHQYFHIFTAAEGVQTCEVPVEPRVLGQLRKKVRSNLWFLSISLLVYISLLLVIWCMDGTPILRMVEGPVIYQTLLAVLLLTNVFEPLRALKNLRRMQEHVQSGKQLDHQADWRERWKINRIVSRGRLVFALFAVTLPLMQLIKTEYGSINAAELEMPYIRLDSLEQQLLIGDEDDELAWHSVSWSLLAPVQYEVDEYGTIKTDNGEMSVRIETELYKLRYERLTAPLVSDLVKWYTYEEVPTFTNRAHPDFDQLLIREALGQKTVIASRGQIVLFARYDGEAELDVLLAQVVQVMEEAARNE